MLNLLHFKKDWYCLLYLVATTGVFAYHWIGGSFSVGLVLISCAQSYAVGCILHCQTHKPMWKTPFLNKLTELWIHILRGDGCYSWVPTHVLNHHRYENHKGDYTLTYFFGDKNNTVELVLYTMKGSILYIYATLKFLKQKFQTKRKYFIWYTLNIFCHWALLCFFLILDWKLAVGFFVLPQAFGFFAMVATGFMQHHHTDETSQFNHSRNFIGRLNNLMHFNHGYHTVHHINSRLHWTEWPEAHKRIKSKIHPELNHSSLPFYLMNLFVFQNFLDRWKTTNFRKSPHLLQTYELSGEH